MRIADASPPSRKCAIRMLRPPDALRRAARGCVIARMRLIALLSVLLPVLVGCPAGPSGDDDDTPSEPLPAIQHNEVSSADEGVDIDLEAIVEPPEGREDEVAELLVQVFHRATGAAGFESFEMVKNEGNGRYEGTIAGDAVTAIGLDYYLQATWVDVFQTHPQGAPAAVHAVVVDPAPLRSPAPVRAKFDADTDEVVVSWTAPGTALFTGYTVTAELDSGATEEVCAGAEPDTSCTVDAGVYADEYATWTVEFTGEDGTVDASGTTDNLHLHLDSWGKEVSGPQDLPFGTGIGEFNLPYGIEAKNGRVWVAEQSNHRVQVFSSGGIHQATIGSMQGIPGAGNSEFNAPSDVVYSDGEVFVADLTNARWSAFSGTSNTWLRSAGSLGLGEGQLRFPVGVAVDGDGVLHVAESANARVSMFDASNGDFLGTWDTVAGNALGVPSRIEYLPGLDAMVVSDGGTLRIKALGEGEDRTISLFPDGDDNAIGGLCVTAFDEIVVTVDGGEITAASTGHNLVKVNVDGDRVGGFGEWGAEDGQFFRPVDCAVDEDGDLYVADALNHRVQVFGP